MINVLIVETANVSKNTTIAHVRNSIQLNKVLNGSGMFFSELVDLNTDINPQIRRDIILFSYAGLGCDFSKIDEVISHQPDAKIGWITNEFELFANGYVKDHMTFMINNFEESGIKKAHRHDQLLTTNLNTLMYDKPNPLVDKKYDICYYGTYRKYRESYFQKYMKAGVILSSSKKNWKKFQDLDLDCNVCDKFSWTPQEETLNLFKASLYIEDTKTHNCFNYMANRFFEALICNTALFFDRSCINTIKKDIYYIDDYFIVDSYEELRGKVRNLDMDLVNTFLKTNRRIADRAKRTTEVDIIQFLKELHSARSVGK